MIALQLFINSLIAGAIYALVAVGFSLIYTTCKFVHFAQGVTVALGAYCFYYLFSELGLSLVACVILSLVLAAVWGWGLNKLIFEKFRNKKASSLVLLMVSFGVLIIVEAGILIAFGADVKTINLLAVAQGSQIGGIFITPLQAAIIVTSLVLLASFYWFFKKTRAGKLLQATADNQFLAQSLGIASKKIFSWVFILGSVLGAIAGILIGLEQNLEPTMGTGLMIKGFAGAIVGGIHSVPGAILGSFLLGAAENFGVWFLPSGYKDAISFTILFVFLLWRPNGILKRS